MFSRNLVKNSEAMRRRVMRYCSSDNMQPPLKGSHTVMTGERGINKATLLGRVGKDCEMRGSEMNPVAIFPLATSLNFKTKDGDYVQKTEWHRICVFKPSLRDFVASNVKKGDRVHISGSISYSSFLDKNQQQQKVTSILADDVITVSSKFRNKTSREEEEEKEDEEIVDGRQQTERVE